MYVFDIYKGVVCLDPSRIAAGVVTGIGFLGAGAIIREREKEGIKGLTTAASLWLVAGIGLATGCGFYSAGFFTTALALIVLLFLGRMERELLGKVD
jgi:putative Mg2+ transporter-C (MgtC) family protein